MKIKILLILTLLTFSIFSSLHGQKTFWQKFWGGSGFDLGKSVHITSDLRLVVAGDTYSKNKLGQGTHGLSDVVVLQYSTLNIVFWKKVLGGSGDDELEQMIPTKDGGYALIGASDSKDGDIGFTQGGTDVWVAKLSGRGELEWSRTFGGKGNDRGFSIIECEDGTYLIGGESGSDEGTMRSRHHGGLDSWIARLDSDGKLIWERHFGGSKNERVVNIHELPGFKYIIVNVSDSKDGDIVGHIGKRDAWVFEMDEYGRLEWQKSYGGLDNENLHSSCMTTDGNIVLAGTSFSKKMLGQALGNSDCWLSKIDTKGNRIWSHLYGGSREDGVNRVKATADGGIVACGVTRSSDGHLYVNNGYYDALAFKLDGLGNIKWTRSFGYKGKDAFMDITETPQGGFLALGYMQQVGQGIIIPGHKDTAYIPISDHAGGYDFWMNNFSDPSRTISRPFLTPPLLTGWVTEKLNGKALEADIILTENSTLDSILTAQSHTGDGKFEMLMQAHGLVSINVIIPGYMFYGEDLLMDTIISKKSITRNIRLEKLRIGSSLTLNNIYFRPGKWGLLKKSQAELERLVKFLKINPTVYILTAGHTDNSGNRASKVELSRKRAEAVKRYLVKQGISAIRIKTKGWGMHRPVVSNRSPEGRRRNRRVEFEITKL